MIDVRRFGEAAFGLGVLKGEEGCFDVLGSILSDTPLMGFLEIPVCCDLRRVFCILVFVPPNMARGRDDRRRARH
jgi:hypothetical protein